MKNSLLTHRNCFRPWLIFAICSSIGGLLVSALFGGIAGGIAGCVVAVNGHPDLAAEVGKQAGSIVGPLAALPISYVCYFWTIKKFILDVQPENKSV